MKEDEIRRLVKIVEESNISQIEITRTRWGKKTIKISKTPTNSHIVMNSAPAPTIQAQSAPPAPAASPVPAKAEENSAAPDKRGVEVKSPMVGTFYRAPAPDADPYIEVGQTVKQGQVLCLIEAMKLMNEIESEQAGKIVDILVQDGQPVEYNQPLFLIEPV
ncbi:MAG: acetyl-CoA carboxylase biotin carboxyl carrier protein [bacterium]